MGLISPADPRPGFRVKLGRYSLLDRSAGLDLLPAALERGAVMVGGVFNSGLLAASAPGMAYDYTAAPDSLVNRALALESAFAEYGVPRRAAAARFPLDHPAVASVLIGARNAAEIRDALGLRSTRAFAARPNTVCKLSGLVTEAAPGTPGAAFRQAADVILSAFGPGRGGAGGVVRVERGASLRVRPPGSWTGGSWGRGVALTDEARRSSR